MSFYMVQFLFFFFFQITTLNAHADKKMKNITPAEVLMFVKIIKRVNPKKINLHKIQKNIFIYTFTSMAVFINIKRDSDA